MIPKMDRRERGQILVIAAVAFAVLLGVAAVVIDLGNGMLERRRLQNTADSAALAAAREILYGGTEAAAAAVAQGIVTNNTGGSVSLPYPPPADGGTGAGLVNGIEFYYSTTGMDSVRLALRKDVSTFLAGILGTNAVTVGVQSRAGMTAIGVLPITAMRYSTGNPDVPLGTSPNPDTVQDYLRRQGSDSIAYWGDHFATPPADVVATQEFPGAPMPFVAQQAIPNAGPDDSFRSMISPYIRDLSSGGTFLPPTYAGPNISTWRELSDLLLTNRIGYTGPLVTVNQEVACFSGTNAGDTASMMRDVFPVGTKVISGVYDGRVFGFPDFTMDISPATQEVSSLPSGPVDTPPTSPGPIEYTVAIKPGSNFYGSYNLTMRVWGLDNWAGEHVRWRLCEGSDCGGVYEPRSIVLAGTTKNITVQVWATPTIDGNTEDITSITGIRMITAEVQFDVGVSGTRYDAATAGLLAGSEPGFYVSPEPPFRIILPAQSTSFVMTATRNSNSYSMSNASVGTPQWLDTGGNVIGTPPGISTSITTTSPNAKEKVATLDVTSSSYTPVGTWRIRVPFQDATTSGEDQYLMLTIRVRSEIEDWRYVRLLGYAAFVISGYLPNATNPNSVEARAISGLHENPNDIGIGMTVRLLGWNQ